MSKWHRLLPDTGHLQEQAVFPLILLIVLFGAIDAWAGLGSYVGGDSVSYMDMAKGVAGGRLAAAVSGYWSPLYPLILSMFIRFVEPDAGKEFVVVRVVNFLIFLVTLGVFHVFLKRFLDRASRQAPAGDASCVPLARWQLEIAAWAAFIWACFSLNQVSRVRTDGCVIAVVFASLAMLLSLGEGKTSSARFIGFGVLLGIGYWVKTVLLPLGFVFLIAALIEPAVWRVRRRLLLSAAALVMVATPLIVAISLKYGKLSYGESGVLNYAWMVNRVKPYWHWQGGPPGNGSPVHASSLIFRNPDAFAFGTPIVATYAPWYDPAYWYEGVKIRFAWAEQLSTLRRETRRLTGILRVWAFLVPGVIFVLSLCVWRYFASLAKGLREFVSLWIVAVAGVGIYLFVFVEARYVASYLCLVLLLLVGAVRISAGRLNRAIGTGVALLCLLATFLTCGPRLASAAELLIQKRGHVHDGEWRVADAFVALGVKPGTPVAVIRGDVNDVNNVWARIALLRVVAEIPKRQGVRLPSGNLAFWTSRPALQEAVLQAFAQNGARFAVANDVPQWADTRGWSHIPHSVFFYRALEPAAVDLNSR